MAAATVVDCSRPVHIVICLNFVVAAVFRRGFVLPECVQAEQRAFTQGRGLLGGVKLGSGNELQGQGSRSKTGFAHEAHCPGCNAAYPVKGEILFPAKADHQYPFCCQALCGVQQAGLMQLAGYIGARGADQSRGRAVNVCGCAGEFLLALECSDDNDVVLQFFQGRWLI